MQGSLDFSIFFRKVLFPFLWYIGSRALVVLVIFLALLVYAQAKYRFPLRFNPLEVRRLKRLRINMPLISFFRWVLIDAYYAPKRKSEFNEYGFTLYCGRQGRGKTISMVNYANKIHRLYPNCVIVSNFKYRYADRVMESWRDLLEIRNGKEGVLFLIDEIHSEYSSAAWKDFPEELLSEISQQRKQRVKIAATAQVYSRVVKQIREQTDTVVQCATVANRWTFNKEYDAKDYELYCTSASGRKHLRTISRSSFVQSDFLRECFDTYEKIKRMKKVDFIPRGERGAT